MAARVPRRSTSRPSRSRRARPSVKSVRTFTAEQCREADRLASEEFGVPSMVLMENAGRSVAQVCVELVRRRPRNGKRAASAPRALILCGPGNNGGDGLVVARHLANRGWSVCVLLSGDPARFRGDSAANFEILKHAHIAWDIWPRHPKPRGGPPTVMVDALLGTGIQEAARGPIAEIIDWVNAIRRPPRVPARSRQAASPIVLSIDIPSGMDADTGLPLGPCVRADATVSLMGLKPGLTTPSGRRFAGRVHVGDIGMPAPVLGLVSSASKNAGTKA